jgi:hypothetical protein
MVDVGKREDRLLDYVNEINGKIKFALVQIEMFREGALTANELTMLNMIQGHLDPQEEAE